MSHRIVTVPFLCALNLFFAGDLDYSKNALTELYYNLSLHVLGDKYELSPTYDAISELTAGISTNIQNAIRSNMLKREEHAANNDLFENSGYKFKPKKSDFEKTEQDIVQSIVDDEPFILKKTDNDYFPPYPEHVIKIEDDFKKDNQDFIKTATELNKVDIGSKINAKNVKIDGVLAAAADLPQPNVKVDDKPNVTDIFGDLFENKTTRREDENFLQDLLTKIDDAAQSHIIPEVKYIPVKIEEPRLNYDDVVIKKEPKIDPDNEPLQDLDACDDWLQKQLKTEAFPDIKPKTETFFPVKKPKTKTFFPDIK